MKDAMLDKVMEKTEEILQENRDLKAHNELQRLELESYRRGTRDMDAKRLGALYLGLPWRMRANLAWTSVDPAIPAFDEAKSIAKRLVGEDFFAVTRGSADWR